MKKTDHLFFFPRVVVFRPISSQQCLSERLRFVSRKFARALISPVEHLKTPVKGLNVCPGPVRNHDPWTVHEHLEIEIEIVSPETLISPLSTAKPLSCLWAARQPCPAFHKGASEHLLSLYAEKMTAAQDIRDLSRIAPQYSRIAFHNSFLVICFFFQHSN